MSLLKLLCWGELLRAICRIISLTLKNSVKCFCVLMSVGRELLMVVTNVVLFWCVLRDSCWMWFVLFCLEVCWERESYWWGRFLKVACAMHVDVWKGVETLFYKLRYRCWWWFITLFCFDVCWEIVVERDLRSSVFGFVERESVLLMRV